MYVCMYVCMHVCMYVCINITTYTILNIAIYAYIKKNYIWRALSSTLVAKSRQPWQTRALEAAVNTAKNCPIVALQHGKVEHYSVVVGAVVLLVWCGCQNSKERAKNIITMACHYGLYLELTFNEGSQLRYHLKRG